MAKRNYVKKHKYTRRDAATLKESIKAAEGLLNLENRPDDGAVFLKASEIDFRPEMFQVRDFSFGARDTDIEHVKKLQKALATDKELDPPVVIKLGETWVCIDGHHRLEAHKRDGRKEKIRCSWFGGTVREAVDEAMRLNKKDRLNVPQRDRSERAWKLVLIGDRSKSEIATLCGVSERTVGYMREVKATWAGKGDVSGKLFRERLAREHIHSLDECSWSTARLLYLDAEGKEITTEEEAAKLARRMNSRLENRLSRNPEITARALAIYDPALPKALMDAWKTQDRSRLEEPEEAEETAPGKTWRPLPKAERDTGKPPAGT